MARERKCDKDLELIYGAKLGFLEPNLKFTECDYGEHAVYAFKLMKRKKKEYENLSRRQIEEEMKELAIVKIARSCVDDELAFDIPKNINVDQFNWLCDNYMEQMTIHQHRTALDFYYSKMNIEVVKNSKLPKDHWLYFQLINSLDEVRKEKSE